MSDIQDADSTREFTCPTQQQLYYWWDTLPDDQLSSETTITRQTLDLLPSQCPAGSGKCTIPLSKDNRTAQYALSMACIKITGMLQCQYSCGHQQLVFFFIFFYYIK